MQDRVPAAGKAGRVRIRQDNGTVIEGVLEMADDATQLGTPLNKANLLSDATAAAIGTNISTPNDALAALADTVNAISTSIPGKAQWYIGSYVGTGEKSKTITFPFRPQLVVITVSNTTQIMGFWIRGQTQSCLSAYATNKLIISWGTDRVSFYPDSSATGTFYLNFYTDAPYYYFGLG